MDDHRAPKTLPWTRLGLALAIVGPPLALGGAPAQVVAPFCLVALLICARLCLRTDECLRVPLLVLLGLVAAGWAGTIRGTVRAPYKLANPDVNQTYDMAVVRTTQSGSRYRTRFVAARPSTIA